MLYSGLLTVSRGRLPKWTGLNGTSELIEDSPPELAKEVLRKQDKEREERFAKGENV